jgi:hypothetical protein
VTNQEEKIKNRSEEKRSDAKIAQYTSTSKTWIVIALSTSAGITSDAPSVVLG